MPSLDHLSYSSISSYLMCPRAWRYHYIDKIETPRSAALVFGSAFHDTIESYLEDRSKRTLLDWWGVRWNAESLYGEIDWGNDSIESLANQGTRILSDPEIAAAIDEIDPLVNDDGQPVIEQRVTLQVPGIPIPIIGYIDLITSDGVPCDFKTSSRSWTQEQAEGETQPLFYLAAMNQCGLVPAGARSLTFRHFVFTKTKTPKLDVFETTRRLADLFWLFDMICEVWRGIEAEVFPPNPGTWKCSPRFCEYWSLCRGEAWHVTAAHMHD